MKRLLLLPLFLFTSCEDDTVICDQSFRSYYMFSKDTLEYIEIKDIDNGNCLFSDSNFYGSFKVIDDSYFHVVGPNKQITLNLKYVKRNDSIHAHFAGMCAFTDDCHINFYFPRDTIPF